MRVGPSHILLLFVDGLGIGEENERCNPCCEPATKYFRHFLHQAFPKPIAANGLALALDACLDWPGLPQSATGQTALLTGVNASQSLGKHLNGFPNQALREIIEQYSLLKTLQQRGYQAAFLNTFRPPFFDYNPYDILRYLSVTSVSTLYAGLSFFNLDDLRQQRSIYHDLTNESLIASGFKVPRFTPEQAGAIIAQRSRDYDFSFFEYFQTDLAGHSQNLPSAQQELNKLDGFVDAVLYHSNLDDTLVLLTSDHGNIENVCVKGHTRNPAMTLLFGCGANETATALSSILDVVPAILRWLP